MATTWPPRRRTVVGRRAGQANQKFGLKKRRIQEKANDESIEPAYYLAKEYFKNHGMDYNRSRIFNAAYEKLANWMKENNIQTL